MTSRGRAGRLRNSGHQAYGSLAGLKTGVERNPDPVVKLAVIVDQIGRCNKFSVN
jgi:hypothetical protein